MDQQQQLYKHYCRICNKGFGCGRALGGHMRAHGISDLNDDDPSESGEWDDKLTPPAAGNKRMYALRTKRCSEDDAGWPKGKRSRRFSSEEEDLANCLVMLSAVPTFAVETEVSSAPFPAAPRGVFECKACKKVFSSHQALGGHRASHKKVKGCFAAKLDVDVDEPSSEKETVTHDDSRQPNSMAMEVEKKTKVHECSICHRVFATGQALGGHKRCHWITRGGGTGSHQLMVGHMFDPSEPLDLNQPAPVDHIGSPLRLEMPTSIYLQPWIDHSDTNTKNKGITSSNNVDEMFNVSLGDETCSEMKLAKFGELKDMNMGGETSPWLQVGIGSSTNEGGGA